MGETTRRFHSGLRQINRLDCDARARVEIMELLRLTARFVFSRLLKHYTTPGLPLTDKLQCIFDLNFATLTEMSVGYKIALVSSSANKPAALPVKIYALAAQRSMTYLSESLLCCMKIYRPVPTGIWHDLHQIYASCEALDCQALVRDHTLSNTARYTVPILTNRHYCCH